jgi:IS30 family transposase
MKRLDNETRTTIRAMREGGYSLDQIRDALKLSKSTVSKYTFDITEGKLRNEDRDNS